MKLDTIGVVPETHRAKKLAVCFEPDASCHVDNMLRRQNLREHDSWRWDLSHGSIGGLGGQLAFTQVDKGNICFFTGVPINGPDVKNIVDADTAARLLPQYDGAFAGVFWDARQHVLIVVTDCLGMQPLYMRHTNDGLTLVSETKAIHGDPDLAAWGAFLSIGHPIGERSLQQGLKRVPPASILTYDCFEQRLDIRRYWHWPEPSEAWRRYDFLQSLEADIHAYAALGDPGTVLLSGGFDSRLLLFLLRRANIPVDGLIVAHEDEYGDADGRLAEAVAKLMDISAGKAYPPNDFFSTRAFLDYLHASDVGFPSLDLFIAKVASQIESDAVWDGLMPGFVFKTPHQPEGGLDAFVRYEVRGPDSAIWQAAKTVFKPEVVEHMRAGFKRDLDAEVSRLPQDEYGLARFVIENRCRNRASMNPLKVFANRAEAFVPGLSKDFLAHAVTIPLQQKQQGQFYRSLFAQLDKKALSVPFLSGGELLRGNRFALSYYRERLSIQYHKYQAQYPSLFGRSGRSVQPRSTFVGDHLLEDSDGWLNPRLPDIMKADGAGNYLIWKLLFHWKAWHWVHEGQLEQRLSLSE